MFAASVDDLGKTRWFRVVGHGTGVDGPTGLAVDSHLRLFVASFGTDQILRYDSVTGKLIDVFINDDEGRMDGPEGLLLVPRSATSPARLLVCLLYTSPSPRD